MNYPHITLAILAKQKSAVLPLYLKCLEALDYPKSNISLYIRTNDNTDNTVNLLVDYILRFGDQYRDVFIDPSSCDPELEKIDIHDWSKLIRFEILSKLRQQSIQYTIDNKSDFYFTIDCDNWILPHTLKTLVAWNVQAISPFIKINNSIGACYANYHNKVTTSGWFVNDPGYYSIFKREVKGLIEVDCIHCTYLIRSDVLPLVKYHDNIYKSLDNHFEYAAFSKSLRDNKIPQYLDNREVYGLLSLDETVGDVENWLIQNTK